MAAGNWVPFNKFVYNMGAGTIDISDNSAGAFKALLLLSTYTPDATDETVDDLTVGTYEAANYTRVALTWTGSTIWAESSGTATFDADDIVFTAGAGACVSKYCVIYYETGAAAESDRELVCYCDLDTGGGSITVNATDTLTVQVNASGILALS